MSRRRTAVYCKAVSLPAPVVDFRVTIKADTRVTIKAATGCPAEIAWDASKPDGTPRKLSDTALIRSLGWTPEISLAEGISRTVADYRRELSEGRIRL